MNLAVISSLASLTKGGAFIGTTIQNAFYDATAGGLEPSEDELVDLVSTTIFGLLSHKQSRQLITLYLVQMHAWQLFIEKHDVCFDVCMSKALSDVEDFLSLTNLFHLSQVIRKNREEFLSIWKSLANNHTNAFQLFGAAVDESFQLLKAA